LRVFFATSAVKSFGSQARKGSPRERKKPRVSNYKITKLPDYQISMKAHLHRRYRFSASHRLHSDQMSEEENRATYGKCNNPHGHGHNYVLEVTVSGQVDENGMVCNLVDLDECVQREVVTRFDLENLNMREEFVKAVPTTENLCTVIYDILKREFTQAHLEKVRLEETMMNSFEYCGN
jgi:6-pyruvoyltetrahydropterin/6-carboxytetrahydropterin synthase